MGESDRRGELFPIERFFEEGGRTHLGGCVYVQGRLWCRLLFSGLRRWWGGYTPAERKMVLLTPVSLGTLFQKNEGGRGACAAGASKADVRPTMGACSVTAHFS